MSGTPTTMPELYHVPGFLDPADAAAVLAEARAAHGRTAGLLGRGAADEAALRVRRTSRVEVSPETRARVKAALMARQGELAERFGTPLGECEEPQFLRYETGDYFVPHQDGNTPMVYDDSRHRRVSAVVFLAPRAEAPAAGAYGGGSLVLHGRYGAEDERVEAPAAPGTLVAFRSETTHEVTPVTHGERYTIVTWFRAPA